MTPPMASPAISDADLARLLGLAGNAPAAPADLVDRIMERLSLESVAQSPMAPVPALRPSRPRRWLRIGIGTGASLLIGTAVAASLAQMPALAPYLQPLLARVATLAGAPPQLPARAAKARPTGTTAPPATPVRIDARLPAPPPADISILPAPILPAPMLAPPAAAPPAAAPTARATPNRAQAARIVAVPAARITADRALPAAAMRRQAAGAIRADLSTAPVAVPDGPGGPGSVLGIAPDRPGLAARAATIIEPRAIAAPPADATTAAPPANQDPAPARLEAALPDSAAERATALAELRAARANGTLTAEQAQRLRSLQQLRAARSARAARDAARRPGN